MINYSYTRGKKRMDGVEAWNNFVEAFIDVFDRAFELCLLFGCEVGYCKPVGGLVFGVCYV